MFSWWFVLFSGNGWLTADRATSNCGHCGVPGQTLSRTKFISNERGGATLFADALGVGKGPRCRLLPAQAVSRGGQSPLDRLSNRASAPLPSAQENVRGARRFLSLARAYPNIEKARKATIALKTTIICRSFCVVKIVFNNFQGISSLSVTSVAYQTRIAKVRARAPAMASPPIA
jgi:hypothetical protein